MKNAFAIAALAVCLSTAHAEGPAQVPDALLACSRIQDVTERVRCYDAQVAAMNKAAGRAAAAPSAPATVAAPAASAAPVAPVAHAPADRDASAEPTREVRGSATPDSARSAPAQPLAAAENSSPARFGEEGLPFSRRPKSSRENEVLVSSITEVSKRDPDIYFFSLANGQIWREEGSRVALFVRAGDPIRIKRTTLGAYHMWTPRLSEKDWMYVRRVR